MKKKLRRAFTIIELVIVIAVIAILAAVLIPTFVNVSNKAKESADIQAVRNMNAALEHDEILNGKPTSVSEIMEVLAEANMDAKGYKALASGHAIMYYMPENIVVYLDTSDYSIVFPEGLDFTYHDSELGMWYKLDGRMQGDESWQMETVFNSVEALKSSAETAGIVKSASGEITAVKVDTSAKLVSVAEYLEADKDKGEGFTLMLGADVNLHNSEWRPITEFRGTFDGNSKTISNMQISDFSAETPSYTAATPASAYYYYGFVSVFSGKEFKDVTFENTVIERPGHMATIGAGESRSNHTVGGAIGGIILPEKSDSHGTYGSDYTVTISNVKVTGTIHAYSRGGGIVGYIGGYNQPVNSGEISRMVASVTIENCTNEATITTDATDQYGTIGGILGTTNQRESTAKVTINSCTNTGTLSGVRVGGIIGDVHGTGSTSGSSGAITITKCGSSGNITVTHYKVCSRVTLSDNAVTSAWCGAGGIYGYL